MCLCLGVGLVVGGCRPGPPAGPDPSPPPGPKHAGQAGPADHSTHDHPSPAGLQASPLDSTNVLRAFVTRGVIRRIPAGGRSLVIQHDQIPGYMPRMTMEFDVRDTNELRGLAVGDSVAFRLKANQDESWIEDLRRAGPQDAVAAAPADPSSLALLRATQLKPGELLPDGELLSEYGQPVRFSDFRGRAVAFTFIFTRCPLPDYCPRMSRNFSRAREILIQRSEAPANWQFISISFDPSFDQPGVLNRYAYSYRGGLTNQWLFASAPSQVLEALSSQVDFRFADEQGSFQHNLRTVVLDTQGRVFRNFEGNRWGAEELAEALVEAARR